MSPPAPPTGGGPAGTSHPDPRWTLRPTLRWGLALAGLTVLAFGPALAGGFVWDDDTMLTRNPLIAAPDGLSRFWFSSQSTDYWPVTFSTLWVEWRLWGLHAAGYHATNLLLHVGEVLLLWTILRRLRIPGAYLAAALFAVHPVNVESVAWIAQRKTLLAMLFYLLSIYCFLRGAPLPPRATGDPGAAPPDRFWTALSLIAFTLGMLSKGSVAMLPAVLLGLVLGYRRPSARDLLGLLPFLAVAVVLVAVNIAFQHRGLTAPIREVSPTERGLGACAAIWFYLAKAVLPLQLAFVYPAWHLRANDPVWWLAPIALVLLTATLWRQRQGWGRPWLFAWAYFCVSLVPVLGLTDVYFMKYSLVADHYQHLALIGVVAAAGAAWSRWHAGLRGAAATGATAAAVAVVGLFAGLTWAQGAIYADLPTLMQAAIRSNPECWMAYNNLGEYRLREGRGEEARADFEQAVRYNPRDAEAQNNLGIADCQARLWEEARGHLEAALRLRPDYAETLNSLGNVEAGVGRPAAAIADFQAALKLKPGYAEALNNLAVTLAEAGRVNEAADAFAQAVRLNPDSADAHDNLGLALAQLGRVGEAEAEFESALRLDPRHGGAQAHLAQVRGTGAPRPP
jgi:tetratricopeptide (TPR) repeat protein